MEIKASELRIGNILNYQTSEGDIMPTTIDWQDLKWISEDEIGFNLVHSRIYLTEEILLKCGFVKSERKTEWDYKLPISAINLYCRFHTEWYFSLEDIYLAAKPIYLHQLQNLYHSLTGQELNIEL